METKAFVYKWTETSTSKWYIGSRTARGCHPDDGYICSSKIVKPLIQSNPSNWTREILCMGHPKDMAALERKLLRTLDATKNPMSYNMANGTPSMLGKSHSDKTREKMRAAYTEEKRKQHSLLTKGRVLSEATRKKMKDSFTEERRNKMSLIRKGVPKSPEHNLKNSLANKGRVVPLHVRQQHSLRMKGKMAGEKNHKAKLTEQMVRDIRKDYDAFHNPNNANPKYGALPYLIKKHNLPLKMAALQSLVLRKTWKMVL